MESKLVIVMIVSIVMGGAIGFGLCYSVLNPLIVTLDNELQNVSSEMNSLNQDMRSALSEVNATLNSLPTEWTTLDYERLNSTINEIAGRKWNLVYHESNKTGLVDMEFPDWFNRTTFRIQGQLMKLEWKLWKIGGSDNYLDIHIYYLNDTLLDSVGSMLTTLQTATVASEREYSVIPGYFYLSMDIRGGMTHSDWFEVNVWDYY